MICKLAPIAVCVALVGCGPSAAPRYELSGAVTYAGKPVPAGSIIFKPDHAKDNRGPGAQVGIEAGRYQLPESRGTIGGPHVVTISGFDGVPIKNGPSVNYFGKPLFANYEVKVDLPREKSERNFDVPAR